MSPLNLCLFSLNHCTASYVGLCLCLRSSILLLWTSLKWFSWRWTSEEISHAWTLRHEFGLRSTTKTLIGNQWLIISLKSPVVFYSGQSNLVTWNSVISASHLLFPAGWHSVQIFFDQSVHVWCSSADSSVAYHCSPDQSEAGSKKWGFLNQQLHFRRSTLKMPTARHGSQCWEQSPQTISLRFISPQCCWYEQKFRHRGAEIFKNPWIRTDRTFHCEGNLLKRQHPTWRSSSSPIDSRSFSKPLMWRSSSLILFLRLVSSDFFTLRSDCTSPILSVRCSIFLFFVAACSASFFKSSVWKRKHHQ